MKKGKNICFKENMKEAIPVLLIIKMEEKQEGKVTLICQW